MFPRQELIISISRDMRSDVSLHKVPMMYMQITQFGADGSTAGRTSSNSTSVPRYDSEKCYSGSDSSEWRILQRQLLKSQDLLLRKTPSRRAYPKVTMRLQTLLLSLVVVSSHADTLPLSCENGVMTTPTYNTTDALFTVCAQNIINSPPSLIYEVLLDFPAYPTWNTFVYAVDLPANVSNARDVYVGMPMVFHTSGLMPGVNTTSDERVTYLEPHAVPSFVAWRFDPGALAEAVMQAEHVSLLQDLCNGSTNYVSWETYYGVGAATVLPLEANLHTQFAIQGTELKARAEGLHR